MCHCDTVFGETVLFEDFLTMHSENAKTTNSE